MAITTVAGVISGLRATSPFVKGSGGGTNLPGANISLWSSSGFPSAGGYDTTLNGVTLSGSGTQVTGQIPFINPAAGNSYLARMQCNASSSVTIILADRLWHNGGYDVTNLAAQNSTTPTWPARDANGATSGDGVLIGLECSAGTAAALTSATISYTNSAGSSGKTGVNIPSLAAVLAARIFIPFSLQAGDTGVQSVQSLTLGSSGTSGTVNLVAYREIARLEAKVAGVTYSGDALSLGFPQMFNGSVPFLMVTANGSAPAVSGGVIFSQG